jgi:cysteine desulfurase/selenocysteine lyase
MSTTAAAFDVQAIRRDFPILHQTVHGHPLVYLDNAATSQKPMVVIDAIRNYYSVDNSNIHRGVHALSERSTRHYEEGRIHIQRFLGAADPREIIFVRGTTEAINLVAWTYGRTRIHAGDEILISALEHHSNIVPWQILCEENGAVLKVAPVDDCGELDMEAFARLLNDRTRLVSVAHISNVLGTVLPIRKIVDLAHARGVPVLVDGAQAAPHMRVNVQELCCDLRRFRSQAVRPHRDRRAVRNHRAARKNSAFHGRRRYDPLGDL